MEYISSDTNIWLDFNTISRIDLPFRLSCTYIMYKEALRKEIISPSELLDGLQKRGLIGVDLTIEEFFYADELSKKYVKLSGYDRTALAVAKFRNILMVSSMCKIIRNAIQCKHCGDTIESVNVHDYVTCSCGACSVDGGHDYLRRSYVTSPKDDYIDLSEYMNIPPDTSDEVLKEDFLNL